MFDGLYWDMKRKIEGILAAEISPAETVIEIEKAMIECQIAEDDILDDMCREAQYDKPCPF
jgi:hypothetical protein